METTTHAQDVVATLGAIEATNAALQAAYSDQRNGGTPNREQIAELHQAIGRGFKRAEVLALLHIGEEIANLARAIKAQGLTQTEIDVLLAHPTQGV